MRIRRFIDVVVAMLVLLLWVFAAGGIAQDNMPRRNNGKPWRIGYYEGGPYSDYTETMRTLIDGLMTLGWIEKHKPPKLHGEIPKPYWQWLTQCDTDFLFFSIDDGYSANWDEEQREQIRKAMMEKLRAGKLDLVIAMGTWAGQDLANDRHHVPTLVLSTSDPLRAGIIKSVSSSGYDHVTARVDPNRYLRQVRMFHRIVGFETLGVAFEDTPDGRVYGAVDQIYKVAHERNFNVVSCNVIDTTTELEESDRTCVDCYRQLADTADAVYVTALTCMDRIPEKIAEIFISAKIPSFAMTGSQFVRRGIMLSISSDSGYAELGAYNADKFGKILNGAKPSSLPQLFEDPLDVAVNRKTAKQIGFVIPGSILKIATEIYDE